MFYGLPSPPSQPRRRHLRRRRAPAGGWRTALPAAPILASLLAAVTAATAETSLQDYLQQARSGDPSAQTYIGYLYHTGQGLPRDPKQAAQWFRQAAWQGHADAQYNLGVLHTLGEGVAPDPQLATRWYQAAARQGHPAACYRMGIAHYYGEGAERDWRAAGHWFQVAADRGYISAQLQLARLYHTGQGLSLDPERAAYWYRRAARGGDAAAQYHLARLYRLGQGIPRDRERAVQWLRRAAKQGYAPAQAELETLAPRPLLPSGAEPAQLERLQALALDGQPEAQLELAARHYLGYETIRDRVLAAHWTQRAAEENLGAAQYLLGHFYLTGEGTAPDPSLARQWYGQAVKQGSTTAQEVLRRWPNLDAELLREELTIRFSNLLKDGEPARAPPTAAAGRGQASAVKDKRLAAARRDFETGMTYALGNGVPRDKALARQWFLKSALDGYAPAQYKIGLAHARGEGGGRDYEQGIRWLELAAVQGHLAAQRELGMLYFHRGQAQDRIRAYAWCSLAAGAGEIEDLRALEKIGRQLSVKEIEAGKHFAAGLHHSAARRPPPRQAQTAAESGAAPAGQGTQRAPRSGSQPTVLGHQDGNGPGTGNMSEDDHQADHQRHREEHPGPAPNPPPNAQRE